MTETKQCLECGEVIERAPRMGVRGWLRKRYCSNACRILARRRSQKFALPDPVAQANLLARWRLRSWHRAERRHEPPRVAGFFGG